MERFYKMAEASNKHFPNGAEPFQMATRLLKECGEVASEINLWEDSGVKRLKHGNPNKENIANEIRQAMVELVKIACYYGAEKELEQSIKDSLARSRAAGLEHDPRPACHLLRRTYAGVTRTVGSVKDQDEWLRHH